MIFLSAAVILSAPSLSALAQTDASPALAIMPAGLADETELVEIACLEARWRSGELLARLMALDSLLGETEADLLKLDIEMDLPGYGEETTAVKARLDNICAAASLSEQQGEIDSLVAYAGNLKIDIPAGLKEKLDGRLKPALEKRSGELWAKYEAEFKAKGEALRKQAEADLKAQSEKAVKEKEAELKTQIEAEIEKRLGARIEAGEFGAPPDQGRIKAEARALAGSEAETKRSELEEAMRAEYEALAKDKEVALRAELDKESPNIEKEKTAVYVKVAEDLGQLSAKVDALAGERAKDWQIYRDQVKAKKGALIDRSIAAQVDAAAAAIEAEREGLASAIANGEELRTADELTNDLRKASAELAAALKSGELMPDQLAQAKEDFRAAWEAVKADMERVKAGSADKIAAKLADEIARSGVIAGIDRYLAWGREAAGAPERLRRVCANPKKGFANTVAAGERCRLCYRFSSGWDQPGLDLARKLAPGLEAAKAAFNEALTARNRPDLTREQALGLKSRVEAAAADLKAAKAEYDDWQEQDAGYRERTEEYCQANANNYLK